MPSWQSRLVLGLLRNRHLFRLRLTRERYDQNTSVDHLRHLTIKFAGMFKEPQDLNLTPVTIQKREGLWIRPAQEAGQGVILYFHGGGYAMGSVQGQWKRIS